MKKTNYKKYRPKTQGTHRDLKKLLALGKKQLKQNDNDSAARTFEKCFRENKRNAESMSYYGLLSALRWGKVGLGINLCTQAIKTNTLNPDFYLNLGRVYIVAQNKKAAALVFKKGLKAAPSNKKLQKILFDIDTRKRPLSKKLAKLIKNAFPVFFKDKLPNKVKMRIAKKANA